MDYRSNGKLPAFPVENQVLITGNKSPGVYEGLTKREWFIGQAMGAMLGEDARWPQKVSDLEQCIENRKWALRCVELADAVLQAMEVGPALKEKNDFVLNGKFGHHG